MKIFIIPILCLPIFLLGNMDKPSAIRHQELTKAPIEIPIVTVETIQTDKNDKKMRSPEPKSQNFQKPTGNTIVISAIKTKNQDPRETILYISTDKNFCENCLNITAHPKKPLKLFLGRIIITQNPLQLRFEPIKDQLDENDIASKEYLLSHEYYDSFSQTNTFYTQELQKTIQNLQRVNLKGDETVIDIFKKLEPSFHFICKENGETYWKEKWILDREALLWSGISTQTHQRGMATPHLNMQLGSCQVVPQANEIESTQCKEWRRSIQYYPPLKSCTILGNPVNDITTQSFK